MHSLLFIEDDDAIRLALTLALGIPLQINELLAEEIAGSLGVSAAQTS